MRLVRILKWLFKILLIIAAILLIVFAFTFMVMFIKEKLGGYFILAALSVLVVLSLIYLARTETKDKKELSRKKSQYLDLGKLVFKNYINEFEVFYKSYLQADNKVSSESLLPIEVLNEFADQKELSLMIDWRGEDIGEIEEFITPRLKETISWSTTIKLREKYPEDVTRDGKFIIRLFKAIDKDLNEANKKLLFFDLGTDAYHFILIDTATFNDIVKFKNNDIHGVEKL